MKHELTKEQIREIYKNPELLKELFPEAFLEAGKWYFISYLSMERLFNFSGDYDINNNPLGYGFNSSNEFIDFDSFGWVYNTIKPATIEQVKEALINEAKKRGYKAGVTVKRTVNEIKLDIKMDNLVFVESMNALYMNSVCIFHDGKWAEIIEETEIDLVIKDKKTLAERVSIRLDRELKRQKEAGKKFISDNEVDILIDKIIKEELGDSWKESYK